VVIRDVSAGRSAELALDRVRKRAEAAMTAARAASRRRKRTIRRLAVQLLCAQQAERRRIGEELHDDVCQRIAALEISVSSLLRKSGGDQSSLEEIRERLSRLGDDVRRLSHDMNPPDVPGAQLVSRLRAHVDELSRLGQLDVRLEIADVPRDLPDDTALCLYRIAQEALRNITRHAQTSTAHIALRSHRGGIALAIGDAGRGFDAIESGRGVGLSTIRHRIERMHGRLEIASAPGAGTRITAWLPCARA
jgi:signal transduction histidine kinase